MPRTYKVADITRMRRSVAQILAVELNIPQGQRSPRLTREDVETLLRTYIAAGVDANDLETEAKTSLKGKSPDWWRSVCSAHNLIMVG